MGQDNKELQQKLDRVLRYSRQLLRFIDRLPMAVEEAVESSTAVILVVEHNIDVRSFIKETLEPYYPVVEAGEGKEGIETAREVVPDLIICDTMIAAPDGYEVCRQLKKDILTSHIAVILLTAGKEEERIDSTEEGLKTRADDYIAKPFNPGILKERVKNLLKLRRGLQENIQREMIMLPSKISVSSLDKTFIKDLEDLIETNMANPGFDAQQLEEMLAKSINPALLHRKIRALTGQDPGLFIRSYRLKRAAQLLKTNSRDIPAVAAAVGLPRTDQFIRWFKAQFHRLPSTFQAAESL
jgi:CheY-like chemotaxis protein/AraC-like DNA-binding protein